MSTTSPTWPEERHPTTAEWVDWFLANDRDGQEEIASKAIGAIADINHCLLSGTCWVER